MEDNPAGNSHQRREQILEHAESLFREQGFRAVSLADIARAVGIRKPSVYHHFSGGKEALFVEVQMRMFARVGDELAGILERNAPNLAAQFHAAADWFLSQPPMFLLSMMHMDMEGLSEAARERVSSASYGLLMQPLVLAVQRAITHGNARRVEPHSAAGAFLALLEANTIVHRSGFGAPDLSSMVHQSIDLLMYGVLHHAEVSDPPSVAISSP